MTAPRMSPETREKYENLLAELDGANFDAWLRNVRAEAWDEGYRLACQDHSTWCRRDNQDHGQRHINPYREE